MPFGTDLHELNKLIYLMEGKFVVPPSEYDRRFVRGNDATLCLFTWTTCRYCHHAATGAMDAESLEKQREAKATEKTVAVHADIMHGHLLSGACSLTAARSEEESIQWSVYYAIKSQR